MSRRLLVVLSLVLVLATVFIGSASAADTTTKQVGLVIGFPDGTKHLEIVTVPTAATTFEVLKAAHIDLATQDAGYGPAVCSINSVGCLATNCFCDAAHFWAYYHLNGTAWTPAAEGVGSYTPDDGAVEGLAWSGFDANYNPTTQPPVYTFAQIVAEIAPQPVSVPEPSTILLLGGGLAGLAAYVRLRKAR